jgi:hypothetical protein
MARTAEIGAEEAMAHQISGVAGSRTVDHPWEGEPNDGRKAPRVQLAE